jgi:hypothetical protein
MANVLFHEEGRLEVAAGLFTAYHRNGKGKALPLRQIRTVTVEEGKAFRHPLLGLAFALALLLPSAGALVALLGRGGLAALLAFRLGAALALGLGLGGVVLWEVLASPRVCWLRVRCQRGGQRIPVPGVSRAELEDFAQALLEGEPESAPPDAAPGRDNG